MNGINFSEGMPLSSELIQHILCFASAEQLGPLIEQRRVCKLFDSNVKGLLQSRWTALSKSEDGEFKNSVIGKNIIQIEDPDKLALIKFQKLAKKLGILPKYLPINKDGLETIWDRDTTMKTLWQKGGLHSLLAQYSTEIPTLDAKASDIFNFLDTVTFESIGCLDFSNLGLTLFPSQILESFPNLVTLDLSYNKMKMLQVQSNSLKQLCINNNELISIPDADCPNLHTLNLENNKITQFNYPKACVKLTAAIPAGHFSRVNKIFLS
jgi:Leucine-rich repeat (LRR) protein